MQCLCSTCTALVTCFPSRICQALTSTLALALSSLPDTFCFTAANDLVSFDVVRHFHGTLETVQGMTSRLLEDYICVGDVQVQRRRKANGSRQFQLETELSNVLWYLACSNEIYVCLGVIGSGIIALVFFRKGFCYVFFEFNFLLFNSSVKFNISWLDNHPNSFFYINLHSTHTHC